MDTWKMAEQEALNAVSLTLEQQAILDIAKSVMLVDRRIRVIQNTIEAAQEELGELLAVLRGLHVRLEAYCPSALSPSTAPSTGSSASVLVSPPSSTDPSTGLLVGVKVGVSVEVSAP